MSLPKIKQPVFSETVPSTGGSIDMRRFLVAEEKALLMAKEAEDKTGIARAIVDVIQSCVGDTLSVGQLKPFDVDWLFLRLRAQSVDNVIQIKYTEEQSGEEYEFNVNLDDVERPVVDELKRVVKVDEDVSVVVTYPSVEQMLNITRALDQEGNTRTLNEYVVGASITAVLNSEGEEFQADTEEEIFEWINQLPPNAYNEITNFLDGIPELTHTITFKSKQGEDKEVVLSGIYDFFIF